MAAFVPPKDIKKQISSIQSAKTNIIVNTNRSDPASVQQAQDEIDRLNLNKAELIKQLDKANVKIDYHYYNKYFNTDGSLKGEYDDNIGEIKPREMMHAICHAINNDINLSSNVDQDTWNTWTNMAQNELSKRENFGIFTFVPDSVKLTPGATSQIWTQEFKQNLSKPSSTGGSNKRRGSKRKAAKKRKTRKYSKK